MPIEPTAPSSPSEPSTPSAPPAGSPPAPTSAAPTPSSPTSPAPTAPAAPDPAAAAAPPAAPAAVERPAGLPERFWDATTGKIKDADLNDLLARDAAAESRKLTLPKTADEYQFALSDAFKPPEGYEFKLDDKDPMVAQYRDFAHAAGLDQSQFSKGLDLIAALRVGELVEYNTAKQAEIGKLGAAGTARVDAVTQWLGSVVGEEGKALGKVLEYAPVASTIVAFEKLMQKFQSQGSGSFSHAHRDGDAPKVDDDTYARMSYSEKKAYAEKHSQPARNGAGR